jgi:hypothetical protein
MALELATRRSREGESVSEATALIEGDDGREGLGGPSARRETVAMLCPHPNKISRAGHEGLERRRRSMASAAAHYRAGVPYATSLAWASR